MQHIIHFVLMIIGLLIFLRFAGKRRVNWIGYLLIGFPVINNLSRPVDAYLLAGMCLIGAVLAGHRSQR